MSMQSGFPEDRGTDCSGLWQCRCVQKDLQYSGLLKITGLQNWMSSRTTFYTKLFLDFMTKNFPLQKKNSWIKRQNKWQHQVSKVWLALGSNTGKPILCTNSSWKETLCLLKWSSSGQFTTLQFHGCPVFYLGKRWINQKTIEKNTFSRSLHKSGFESSSKKTEQASCVPYRIRNNRFYFWEQQTFHSCPKMQDSDYHLEMKVNSFKDCFMNRFLH
jgi:hypothetical protein